MTTHTPIRAVTTHGIRADASAGAAIPPNHTAPAGQPLHTVFPGDAHARHGKGPRRNRFSSPTVAPGQSRLTPRHKAILRHIALTTLATMAARHKDAP